MSKVTQDRLKSPYLWYGIASIVVLLLGNYGGWAYIGMEEGVFRKLIELVLSAVIALGVINNPTDPVAW